MGGMVGQELMRMEKSRQARKEHLIAMPRHASGYCARRRVVA